MPKPLLILDQHFRTVEELFDAKTFQQLGDLCQIEGGENAPMAHDRLAALLEAAEFLVAARPEITPEILSRAPNLRAVIEVSGAFHGEIDYAACFDRGIEVLSCAPGFRCAVAEMGLAMLLAAGRGLVAEHEAFRDGREAWLDDRTPTDFALFDQRIGFVGYGSIARELHRLLAPFEPDAFAYDPWLSSFPEGVIGAKLPELFKACRAIIVTAVPTDENYRMIGADLIDAMQPGSALVLLSRAHVIDFDAAIRAAESGRITFATDVFPSEPVDRHDSIRKASQVIYSPHRAAAVPGGRQAIGSFILHDIQAILTGTSERRLLVADESRVAGLVRAQEHIERAGRLPKT